MSPAARGAVAGALAAGVWAAQEPLDKRVFGVPYSDVELLGKAITRAPAWPATGLALHLANGAVFGALYGSLARRLPGPPLVRGLAAAIAEHLASWPLIPLVERHHPAREELPTLWCRCGAFAQASWRHALFGACLGTLQARLDTD